MILRQYTCNKWDGGAVLDRVITNPITGDTIARLCAPIDLPDVALRYARNVGGTSLRALTFRERGALLQRLADVITANEAALVAANQACTGNTLVDAAVDIQGAAYVFSYFAGLGAEIGSRQWILEEELVYFDKRRSFGGRHVQQPRRGVGLGIGAYNFPGWAGAVKIAPAILAGVPAVFKPATPTAPVAHAIMERWVDAGVLIAGAVSFIPGAVTPYVDELTDGDGVSFTGSYATARILKAHSVFRGHNVRLNIEADSINTAILGMDVERNTPLYEQCLNRVVHEVMQMAGQKCTAIRKLIVPRALLQPITDALAARFAAVSFHGVEGGGDTAMGPLVSHAQYEEFERGLEALAACTRLVYRGDGQRTPFQSPVLLVCNEPATALQVHQVELFGPALIVMPYEDTAQAAALANMSGGSLLAVVFTDDPATVRFLLTELGPHHGRVYIASTGTERAVAPGIAMPQLMHGGSGRAGGGQELGGLRALDFYLERTAVQGSAAMLAALDEAEHTPEQAPTAAI